MQVIIITRAYNVSNDVHLEYVMVDGLIVLAHGVLGFGNPLGLPSLVNYFNGVEAHLKGQGYQVFAPQVNQIGRAHV